MHPQGTLAPGRTALLRQPDHDAVGKCAARCEADAGCVSFDAGTADGGTRCYRRPEDGGGVNGTSLSYQYFSLPGINASEDGCVPLARGCGRNGSALGAITRPRRGCTNATAFNYNATANVDDGSCTDEIVGCQDPRATNYNAAANSPDADSCEYPALDNFTCAEADKYLPGFNIIRTDVPGELNHYTGLTVEECAARCLASAECESFDFAAAAQPDGSQSMCFLGDGALNQGAVHEAKNLAGLLDLPVIYIVENNGYSMGTAISRGTTVGHEITRKADAYGIESAVIDGLDVLSVYRDMKPLVEHCRQTSRPAFVDMRTYRFKGHSMSDPRKYRTKEEEAQYELLDPIARLSKAMISNQMLTDERFKEIGKEVRQQVREAIKWSVASKPPGKDELYKDVYVEKWGPYTGTSLPEMLGGDES